MNKSTYIIGLLLCLNIWSQTSGNVKEHLLEILKQRPLDLALVKGKKTNIIFNNIHFSLDDKGIFYKVDNPDLKYKLEIFIDSSRPGKEFLIWDPSNPPVANLVPNPLSTKSATTSQVNDFDDIVSAQRQYGIFTMKNLNSECYFAYAQERLGEDALEKLLAMERSANPRPLAFANDSDWQEFKQDLQKIFSSFKGPQSYIVIIGTSTSFFSENPRKGKNMPLFETAPTCIRRAKDPIANRDVYTYDTPGHEPSDIDIHFFIPELSDLCDKANTPGNNGLREAYWENTMDKCLAISPNSYLKNLVNKIDVKVNSLIPALTPNEDLDLFFKKWTKKLNNREINFSVHIRPNQRMAPLHQPIDNFNQSEFLKSRFVIPLI